MIDARGKFVIPGLADMRNHLQTGGLPGPQNLADNLTRLTALGITVILDANPLEDIRNVSRIYRTLEGGVVLPPAPAQPQ